MCLQPTSLHSQAQPAQRRPQTTTRAPTDGWEGPSDVGAAPTPLGSRQLAPTLLLLPGGGRAVHCRQSTCCAQNGCNQPAQQAQWVFKTNQEATPSQKKRTPAPAGSCRDLRRRRGPKHRQTHSRNPGAAHAAYKPPRSTPVWPWRQPRAWYQQRAWYHPHSDGRQQQEAAKHVSIARHAAPSAKLGNSDSCQTSRTYVQAVNRTMRKVCLSSLPTTGGSQDACTSACKTSRLLCLVVPGV